MSAPPIHPITRDRLTYDLPLKELTGIEIGPLVRPIVTREMSNVRYVDRATTEELQEWYKKDPQIDVKDITQIDYVWGEQSLAEATGGNEQFDYCIASHVIEHIPDLITWLNEISSILKIGGVACFAVPDKRYTFDYLRKETTIPDIVESYLLKRRKPSLKHIYDHFANHTNVDITEAWQANYDGSQLAPNKKPKEILKVCENALKTDKYIDSHCSVFTIHSFFALLKGISELGLLNFRIKHVFPVVPGMLEFYVQLEKLDENMDNEAKLQTYNKSYTKLQENIENEPIIEEPKPPIKPSLARRIASRAKRKVLEHLK